MLKIGPRQTKLLCESAYTERHYSGQIEGSPNSDNRPNPGRLKSTTAVKDRFLRLTAMRRRFKSSFKINANHRRVTGVSIHPRTVRNRFKSAGIKPRRPCLRNKLTPQQAEKESVGQHHLVRRIAFQRRFLQRA